MQTVTQAQTTSQATEDDFVAGLLKDYRFSVCQSREEVAEALDVRRQVYVDGSGYDIPVPDPYDHRSWLLVAREAKTGKVVGTMRITPRAAGPVEAEEYFKLPVPVRSHKSFEISRFAILPEHRKGKTFLPVVLLGLFKCAIGFLKSIEADYVVICSKAERVWTYEWIRFQSTGLKAKYEKLNGAEHELLWYDFRHIERVLDGHPFAALLLGVESAELSIPSRCPALGLQDQPQIGYLRAVAS